MVIEVKNGLIYSDNKVVPVFEADRIAVANDLHCAECFVEKHTGDKLELDAQLKVIKEIE